MSWKTLGAIAGVLAVNAGVVVWLARRAERRHPPHGRFVEAEGLRLHYLERGPADAPAVVLLHGNGAMIAEMEASGLVDRLAQNHRVICFDRPGFGHSDRPHHAMPPEAQARLLAAALARLGIAQTIVLGHSWGTLVAIALALEAPRLVTGLVLAGGYYVPTRRLDVWVASAPSIPLIGTLLRYTVSPLLGYLLAPKIIRILFAPRPVPPAFQAGFPLALALRPSHLRAAAEESGLMVPAARRLQARYKDLTCPVAIFHATGDRVAEPEQGPRLHELLPAATLTMVEETGHMLHYAVPETIATAVDSLQALPGAGSEALRRQVAELAADVPMPPPDGRAD